MLKNDSSRRRVSFGHVQVRDYERIAGDHPDVLTGPSLSIGWGFVQKEDVQVTAFEEQRRERANGFAPLNAKTRRFLLSIVFDVPKEDIASSERRAERVRRQRQETLHKWHQYQSTQKAKFQQVLRENMMAVPGRSNSGSKHLCNVPIDSSARNVATKKGKNMAAVIFQDVTATKKTFIQRFGLGQRRGH